MPSSLDLPKDQLIKMLVDKTLFGFLMKKNIIRKGDLICYGRLLNITGADLQGYFDQHGYPGLAIPRKMVRTSPEGSEGDTVWTCKDGLYTVWTIERNTPFEEYSTESRSDFETWWKKHELGLWERTLNNEWTL